MATETVQTKERSILVYSYWPYAALLGGLVGAIRPLFNVLVDFGPTAGVLVALPEIQFWWVIHVAYSAVFGAGFGLVVYYYRIRPYSELLPTGAVLGLGYGIALWFGNIVVGWNLILEPYVLSLAEPVDAFAAGPIVDHVVFGLVLGIAYAIVIPRLSRNGG